MGAINTRPGFWQYFWMAVQKLVLPAVYSVYRRGEIEKGLVLFADAYHDRRPEDMDSLYEALSAFAQEEIAAKAAEAAEDPASGSIGEDGSDGAKELHLQDEQKQPKDPDELNSTDGQDEQKEPEDPDEMNAPDGQEKPEDPDEQNAPDELDEQPDPEDLRDLNEPEKPEKPDEPAGPDDCLHIEELYLDYANASFSEILRHMVHFMKRYASAEAVVLCDVFPPAAGCRRKRKETTLLQLWHGCGAIKRFGYDVADEIPAAYGNSVFRGTDLVTVSASPCVKPFASAMRLKEGQIQQLGICRTDCYYDMDWHQACRQQLWKLYPQLRPLQDTGKNARKLVVWAPTFRGTPAQPECIPLDVDVLQRRLGEEYLVLTCLPSLLSKEAGMEGLNCPIPARELFPCADLLISDYSSLICDWMLFDKPLILYIPDYGEFIRDRGFCMDYEQIPGRKIYSEADLAQAILEETDERQLWAAMTQEEHAGMAQRRQAFLQTWMSACDGHSTDRAAQYLLGRMEKGSGMKWMEAEDGRLYI